ncbi:MAG: hypothetical protein PHT34_05115 [Oscillospiraceae bacterium]|nr:hypothetical protein [Oscillospiraceae bacterium]
MQQLSDHPQTRRALRTGYPQPEEKPLFVCQGTGGRCGAPIYEEDFYYDVDGSVLCEECGPDYFSRRFGKRAARDG